MAAPYTIDAAVQRFLDHLRIERGLSANTMAAYGTDLARFARELVRRRGNRVRLKDIGEPDVLAHLGHLVAGGMTIASQARHLTVVRYLFRHLKQQELISVEPADPAAVSSALGYDIGA